MGKFAGSGNYTDQHEIISRVAAQVSPCENGVPKNEEQ